MDFTHSSHPITWFRDRYREGTLVIKPAFQRKPVWAARQKCYLIESILLDLPIPEIYVQRIVSAAGDTTYAVVDGQQRVRAVLQFLGAEIDPEENEHNDFPLDRLDAASPWRNLTFGDLSEGDRIRFFSYEFAVRFLNTSDDGAVRDMFRRLNRFQTPLNASELRNATYFGHIRFEARSYK